MTSPRIIKQAARPTFLSDLVDPDAQPVVDITPTAPVRPVPQMRATRDAMPVLHQIRALLVSAVTALAVCVLLLASIADDLDSLSNATPPPAPPAPAQVVLTLAGDPAMDYMAHVVLADGTERDVQLGSLLLDSPVRISLHANSPADGATSCLIELDGAPVASETSQDGGTATCDWTRL